jgi:hypothetical protein
MSRTFSPSSGPHSYTRTLPHGESTSLAPGNASSGYGSLVRSSAERRCTASLGETMGLGLLDLRALDTVPTTSRVPTDAAPMRTYFLGGCR